MELLLACQLQRKVLLVFTELSGLGEAQEFAEANSFYTIGNIEVLECAREDVAELAPHLPGLLLAASGLVLVLALFHVVLNFFEVVPDADLAVIFPERPDVIESSHFHFESLLLDQLFLSRIIRQREDYSRCRQLVMLAVDPVGLEADGLALGLSLLFEVQQLQLGGVRQ